MSAPSRIIQDVDGNTYNDPLGITDWLAETPALAALNQLNKFEAELSLKEFIKQMWPVVEPGRQFVSGWTVDAVCEHLQAITDGHIRRLVINVPPGFMKSMTTNVFWPAWEWGPRNLPSMRYVGASYAESLTVRDNRKCRSIIQSQEYLRHWHDRFSLSGDQNAKVKFENDKTGWKLATGVTGVGTGERGDRFVIDDPHNVKQAESEAIREGTLQWFSEVVPTRINDTEKSAILVIMQRVHERDVSGLILAEELNYEHLMIPLEFEPERKCWICFKPEYTKSEKPTRVLYNPEKHQWQLPEHYSVEDEDLPAPKEEYRWSGDPRTEDGELAWPERFSKRYIEEDLKPSLRSWGGEYAEAGQLQQRPSPRGGGMFKKQWFPVIDSLPANDPVIGEVRGWDLAATDDNPAAAYTVGLKMVKHHSGFYTIVDVARDQLSDAGVMQLMRSCAEADGLETIQDIPQDPGQAGKAQIRALVANLDGYPCKWGPENGDKVLRARPVAAQAEIGNIRLLKGTWNKAFLDEVTVFPVGTRMDQVDGLSRAFSRLSGKKKRKVLAGGLLVGSR